jgi:hypothetical protein
MAEVSAAEREAFAVTNDALDIFVTPFLSMLISPRNVGTVRVRHTPMNSQLN